MRSQFQQRGPVQFSYYFPEVAPDAVKLEARPAEGSGEPVEMEQLLYVEASIPRPGRAGAAGSLQSVSPP